MTAPDGNLVTTGSFKTHYLDSGEGKPVILLHGGGAGADGWSNWQHTLPAFSTRVRALAVDLVGFGRSDKPDPANFTYSQGARTRQLIDFIEALGLEKVSIVGNSMGGCTALGVAIERPDLLENLVLMGSAGLGGKRPAPKPEAGAGAPPISSILNYDYTLEGMRRVVNALTAPGYEAPEDQVQYRYEIVTQPDTRAAYEATNAWVRENGLHHPEEKLRQIKTRTLIVNGKDDKIIPITVAYKALEMLENSTGYILPHCGHWAMIEHPDEFARVTLDFLTDEQAG